MSAIMFGSVLAMIVLMMRLREYGRIIYWCAALGRNGSVTAAQRHHECQVSCQDPLDCFVLSHHYASYPSVQPELHVVYSPRPCTETTLAKIGIKGLPEPVIRLHDL